MKKTILSLAVAAITAFSVHAQEPTAPATEQQHPAFKQHRHRHLADQLQLSSQQQQQWKEARQQFQQRMAELRKNEDITVREYRARLAAIRKEQHEKLQSLLSTEQKEKLARFREERHHGGDNNFRHAGAKLPVTLGLTPEQSAKLKTLRTETADKIKTLRSDNSLSSDQKHAQIKAARDQQKDQLKDILTATQLQQLQQFKQEHSHRNMSR